MWDAWYSFSPHDSAEVSSWRTSKIASDGSSRRSASSSVEMSVVSMAIVMRCANAMSTMIRRARRPPLASVELDRRYALDRREPEGVAGLGESGRLADRHD